jgi:hypothetical protein
VHMIQRIEPFPLTVINYNKESEATYCFDGSSFGRMNDAGMVPR